MINRMHVKQAFADYTKNYDPSDPKIALKISHTYRVADYCEQIAKDESLNEKQIDLAWLTGMLHDVGRFEQVRRFGTFEEAKSVDHANLGADLLFKEDLYDSYVTVEDFDSEAEYLQVKALTETAIRNHSRFRLEEGISEEEILFCNILRDADKIDIFRVNCDTPLDQIHGFSMEELQNSQVTKEVMEDFDAGSVVLRAHRKAPVDYVVSMVALYNELVFPISREISKNQEYLPRLLDFESQNPDAKDWFAHMRMVIYGPEK